MNVNNHPCFNANACKNWGRVHLPVAPRCNIQCNFCNRKFDCVNESRPGVSSGILSPFQAMEYLKRVVERKKNISVVGIAGPGDPFANPEETLQTIEMINREYPDMLLCLASNGLNLPDYLDDIAKFNVSHVSITINAIDLAISEKIYSWVRFGKKSLNPKKGVKLLLEKQMESVVGLKERGIIVKVNTIVLPGINDHHVVDIAREMSVMGVDLLNCMPYYPNEGSNFSHLGEPSKEEIATIQKEAQEYIPQMKHCRRCRADAVGILGEAPDKVLEESLIECASLEEFPEIDINTLTRPYVAVGTREGVLVNQHLGEATELSIYDPRKEKLLLVEKRPLPQPGGGNARWHAVAECLKDCHLILVGGVGEAPKEVLVEHGFDILMVNGLIQEVVDGVKNKQNITHLIKRAPRECQAACSGSGMGCM